MLYFTGDMHGDKRRFGAWRLRWLGARDTLVICGDFGFLWNGSQEEREVLEGAVPSDPAIRVEGWYYVMF